MDFIFEPNTLQRVEDLPQPAPGEAGGLAGPLDGAGKLPEEQLPDIALTDVYVVTNQTERLSLAAQIGDAVIQTDSNLTFLLQTEPASINSNWVQLPIQPQTTSTHGGGTNAGKLLALDGAGKADGRNLQADGASLDAVVAAPVITTTASSAFSGEVNLGALSSGVLKSTVSAGTATLSIAVPGVDFDAAGSASSVLSAALSALSSHTGDSTDAHASTAIGYTPTTGGDWSPTPVNVGGALDQVAGRVTDLEQGTGNVTSFNGRSGAVSPADGDYSQNQITGLKTSSNPSFLAVTSTVATGTPPFSVSSTTKVSSLNADKVDGYDASQTAAPNTIPVSSSGGNTIDRSFIASGGGIGYVPVQQSNGLLVMGPQTVSTSGGLSGGTGALVYEADGGPIALGNNESLLIPVGALTDPRIDVIAYMEGAARTNQVASYTFTEEADYVQQDATNGTDFLSSKVLLHRTLSDNRIKLMLQGNGAASDVPFEPFLHTLGGTNFEVSTLSPKYGSGCVNISPGTGIQINTTGDIPNGWGSYSWTLESWVRFDALTGFRGIFCSNNSSYNTTVPTAFLLAMNGTSLYFFASDNNGTWAFANNLLVKTGMTTGTWYHLAVDYDPAADTMHVYVNGIVEATVPGVSGLYTGDKYLSLGYWNYLTARFDGQLDDVRLTIDSPSNPPIYGGLPFTPPAQFTDPSYPLTGYYVYTGNPLAFPTARVASFDSLTITQNAPGGSQLRYLISWDGGSVWKDHTGTTQALADIHTAGSTAAQMLTYFSGLAVPGGASDIRIAIGLQTTDSTLSPSVSAMALQYDEIAPWVPVAETDREIRVWLGAEGAVEWKNVSGGTVQVYVYARIM